MALTKVPKGKLTEKQQKMVEDNMGLVHSVINKNWKTHSDLRDDFTQEGYAGLSRAVQMYDESKGKFSTIAYHYINGYILRYFTYNETSDFKVTEGNYREARVDRALRFEQPLRYEGEGKSYLGDTIADGKDYIEEFEHNYSLKQDFKHIFQCISEEDYAFLINYITQKKEPRKTKEHMANYRKYNRLIRKIKIFNKVYKDFQL